MKMWLCCFISALLWQTFPETKSWIPPCWLFSNQTAAPASVEVLRAWCEIWYLHFDFAFSKYLKCCSLIGEQIPHPWLLNLGQILCAVFCRTAAALRLQSFWPVLTCKETRIPIALCRWASSEQMLASRVSEMTLWSRIRSCVCGAMLSISGIYCRHSCHFITVVNHCH